MTPCDQNDFFHLFYPQAKPSSKGEPTVDMFDHPPAKIPPRNSVLTVRLDWKG
jgi:hypothetical protein